MSVIMHLANHFSSVKFCLKINNKFNKKKQTNKTIITEINTENTENCGCIGRYFVCFSYWQRHNALSKYCIITSILSVTGIVFCWQSLSPNKRPKLVWD